jgi:hypothetical protein
MGRTLWDFRFSIAPFSIGRDSAASTEGAFCKRVPIAAMLQR